MKANTSEHVLALADVRTKDPQRVSQIIGQMSKCPHSVFLLPGKERANHVMCLYALPEDKVWWILELEKKPDLIDAQSVKVTLFSQGHPQDLCTKDCEPQGEPPCGSHCDKCPYYKVRCKGCPASSFFLADM